LDIRLLAVRAFKPKHDNQRPAQQELSDASWELL